MVLCAPTLSPAWLLCGGVLVQLPTSLITSARSYLLRDIPTMAEPSLPFLVTGFFMSLETVVL